MINLFIYSHTDYLDVLKIQTDYTDSIKDKILFINKNNLDNNHIYSKYKKVIFYDDSIPYSRRIIECLTQIDDEYILLCHDIDIILNFNQELINQFHNFLKYHNFDRIDLKHFESHHSDLVYCCDDIKNYLSWSVTDNVISDNKLYLMKQNDSSKYIYNVNPSIWKKESILDIMYNFPNKDYRSIEGFDVQEFSKKFTIFKIFTSEKKICGHFHCIDDFIFFHISHSGKFVPLNNYQTIYGQSYIDVKNEYEKIILNYDLKKNNKWIN